MRWCFSRCSGSIILEAQSAAPEAVALWSVVRCRGGAHSFLWRRKPGHMSAWAGKPTWAGSKDMDFIIMSKLCQIDVISALRLFLSQFLVSEKFRAAQVPPVQARRVPHAHSYEVNQTQTRGPNCSVVAALHLGSGVGAVPKSYMPQVPVEHISDGVELVAFPDWENPQQPTRHRQGAGCGWVLTLG